MAKARDGAASQDGWERRFHPSNHKFCPCFRNANQDIDLERQDTERKQFRDRSIFLHVWISLFSPASSANLLARFRFDDYFDDCSVGNCPTHPHYWFHRLLSRLYLLYEPVFFILRI